MLNLLNLPHWDPLMAKKLMVNYPGRKFDFLPFDFFYFLWY